jgi:DNA-binding response OmpR family regulator
MPRILHVEDDGDLTQILSEAMRGRARFTSAQTLKDAYRELHSHRPDLVIIDLGMPDGSGLELLEHIHENLDYSVPLLILSASETTQDVQAKVAKALVKSRMSEDKIVETILSLIHPAETMKKETA